MVKHMLDHEMRILVRTLLYAFAAIGFAWSTARLMTIWHDHNIKYDDVSVFLSPNKTYKLVLFSSVGGGGISPYCAYDLAVVPADWSEQSAEAPSSRVAEFGCSAFAHGGLGRGVTWVGDKKVSVAFDLNAALQHGPVRLRDHDATGEIAIYYKSSL